jgi:hypothetical protein
MHLLAHHQDDGGEEVANQAGPRETWLEKDTREKKKEKRDLALRKLNQKLKQRHEYKMQQVSSNI